MTPSQFAYGLPGGIWLGSAGSKWIFVWGADGFLAWSSEAFLSLTMPYSVMREEKLLASSALISIPKIYNWFREPVILQMLPDSCLHHPWQLARLAGADGT